MFVRVIAGLIVTTGAAQASSFVVMGESVPASTPSILTFGAPAPASAGGATPSIVAMGEPLPAVTDEKVAAIAHKRKRGPRFQPLVIRGGLAGDAFTVAEPNDRKEKPGASPQQAASGADAPPEPPAPAAPPAYLPPNGLGKHRR